MCPQCGASVAFASSASASAVCSYCRSTLLREGEALKRIGLCGELFDDHSPLQLGSRGRYQGVAFTLVGRLQYRYDGGSWNEWFALFERPDGREKPAWLSEDNGAYVLAFDLPQPADAPLQLALLRAGLRRQIDRRMWTVASVQRVHVQAAEGELPRPPRLSGEFTVVDLRNDQGQVGTLDDSAGANAMAWSVGQTVTLAALAMDGLREGVAEKTQAARAFECPSCGHALQPTLASTRSISCPACSAVVDVSKGLGAELAHYAQNNSGTDGAQPLIPLGRSGRLALGPASPQPWQVVGYMERCTLPDTQRDEQYFWREYLLYHRTLGFAFLVDSDEGWSWARPVTGAPRVLGRTVLWQARRYQQHDSYRAKVTWVQGEFYWRVQQEETALVTDYQGPSGWRLSREHSPQEVVWSDGQRLDARVLAQAFALTPEQTAAMRRDAAPTAGLLRGLFDMPWWNYLLLLGVLLPIIVDGLRSCMEQPCQDSLERFGAQSPQYQQCMRSPRSSSSSSGGSYGGYSSSGGGHK